MYLDDERPQPSHPRWMTILLWLLAARELLLGILLLSPGASWTSLPVVEPRGLAVMVLILALGLYIASHHPFRHWPILLVAALDELNVAFWLWEGASPWLRAWLVTAVPEALLLGYMVFRAWQGSLRMAEEERRPTREILEEARTQDGTSLLQLSETSPLLLVCLRHFGCIFCREALTRLARDRQALEACGVRITLLHMSPEDQAEAFFASYGLQDLPRVSDPRRWVYFHLGLRKGGLWQLFGPKVWWRGFLVTVFRGQRLGRIAADPRQMPGVFLVHHGEVLKAFLHRTAADNPDYRELGTCPSE
jgi:hypothetical protein